VDLDEILPVLCAEGEKRPSGLQLLLCDLQSIAETSRRLHAFWVSHKDCARDKQDPKVKVVKTSTFGP
jgi:hypothetical protein